MNAIALHLPEGNIIDPFDGRSDIKRKIIRTVGNPRERFGEDGLRPVRAIRFSAQLDFSLEENTLNAIPQALPVTEGIATERFRDEFIKMLGAETPSKALLLMETTGLLALFLPELAACRGVEQKGFHRFDVLDHLLYSCDGAPRSSLRLRLTALFHDIGKPAVRALKDGVCTFYRHEDISASMTEAILTRLRFPKAIIREVTHLIANHMFHYEESWTDAAVRRFLVRVTPEAVDDLFDLRYADLYGMNGTPPPPGILAGFEERIRKVLEQQSALGLKDLAVNGKDLMTMGIPAGKQLGIVLNELLETVLDDPGSNTRENLLVIAEKMYHRISG
jgi:putative nucleotidyltransferase with HDIG domain